MNRRSRVRSGRLRATMCPSCDRTAGAGDSFCRQCGTGLSTVVPAADPHPAPEPVRAEPRRSERRALGPAISAVGAMLFLVATVLPEESPGRGGLGTDQPGWGWTLAARWWAPAVVLAGVVFIREGRARLLLGGAAVGLGFEHAADRMAFVARLLQPIKPEECFGYCPMTFTSRPGSGLYLGVLASATMVVGGWMVIAAAIRSGRESAEPEAWALASGVGDG